MKKTYQMFFALVAMLLLGATNVSAEEISLQEVPFWAHEAGLWGLEAPKNTPATPDWVVGESTGQPYGDSSVNAWADLSGFDKLVITYTEGTPRVMMNRDMDEGQFNTTETESHLIEYPKGASSWAGKYFVITNGEEEGVKVLTVDLKQILNDKGFVHLHAIKGADWANVTVTSMVVTRKGKEKQVGWVNILTNSDLEGEDVSSFVTAIHADEGDGNVTFPAVIEDGVGVNGSRGISLKSDAGAPQTWTTQLFVYLPEILPVGTQWRFSMDVVANPQAEVDVAGHADPRAWKCGGSAISEDFANPLTFNSDWTKIEAKGTISESLFGNSFQSICFDLNKDKETATQYYFDNIKFEIYKYGTVATFCGEVAKVDFGFETNIPELCKAAGKSRVIFPTENVKVLANGQEISIISAEGFADGRFYIFLEEALEDNAEVQVIYNNVVGDLQLKYAGGPNAGQVIPNVDEIADFDAEAAEGDDIYSYAMLSPSIVSAYPEQGSFNVKKDLKEFKVKFDKNADASQIVAKLDGNALTVSPNDGYAEEFVLKYAGEDLKDGLHTINITKIYPEAILDESVYADTTYQFSVGAPDPNDVLDEKIPVSYFNTCAMNSIPEGFKLYADNMEVREAGGNYGSGSRMFNDFASGGDFTSALYMRSNYLTYGFNDDTHKLTLEADKTYTLTFNTARWKSSGEFLKVLILDAAGNELLSKTVTCNPDVNGTKNAVKGSSAYSIDFTPVDAGDYELRFVVANNADGEDAGETWHELLLANVKFAYIPSSFGVVEMLAVSEALEKAKKTQDDNKDARFDGDAQTALNNAIAKVEGEKDGYTSPSECEAAIELLDKCGNDLVDHVALCNNYDNLIKTGSATVDQNKETKFKNTALYGELVTIVDKYHGRSWMENVAAEGEEAKWERKYEYDVLKDDAALTAAVAELNEIATTTANLFTVHNSSNSESDGNLKRETRGTAPLVERLYLGAQELKVLDAEDPAIQIALDALDDDDSIAEALMAKITKAVYGKLKDNENIFETVDNSDPENPETKAVAHDMSVFVKNPNLYAREFSKKIPGWTDNDWAWSSWDGNVSHNAKTTYAENCAIHPGWHATATVEQTITNLPKGVYTIKFRGWDNSDTSDGTYAYVKTSATPAVEEGAEIDMNVNYAGYALMESKNIPSDGIQNIVVTDGILTLGFAWGGQSQAFFEYVNLFMTGKAEGVDYAKEYGDASGIEIVEVNNKAQNGVLYNIAGQKVDKSFKGIVIMNGKKVVIK